MFSRPLIAEARGGVGQNGAVALVGPAKVQAAVLAADRQLVVKPRGEDDFSAHLAQRWDLVFQVPAVRVCVDALIQGALNVCNVILLFSAFMHRMIVSVG